MAEVRCRGSAACRHGTERRAIPGVEGQLTEGKQGGGNALITFGGGHNMQLLCGDHGEKIAADAPQAEPGSPSCALASRLAGYC